MSRLLFENFLNNSSEYERAVAFWDELVRGGLKKQFDSEEWKSWLNTSFENGSPDRDGNPIVSYISNSRHKAIKIVQLPPCDLVTIDASIRLFAPNDPEEIPYLEIIAVLTEKTAAIAKGIIEIWLASDEPITVVDSRIKEICAKWK